MSLNYYVGDDYMTEFIKPMLRPLPVILLLDTSGSMYGEKIDTLNIAVKNMLESFKTQVSTVAEIYTSVITFGGRASIHSDFAPASQVKWTKLDANGGTPLGQALTLCTEVIQQLTPDKFNGKPYRPTIVLVSDGEPTDDFNTVLDQFLANKKTSTCDRWALAIGDDANVSVLERFLTGQEKRIMQASDASGIAKFFEIVTNSTQKRTESSNPNVVDAINIEGINDDVLFVQDTDSKPTLSPTNASTNNSPFLDDEF